MDEINKLETELETLYREESTLNRQITEIEDRIKHLEARVQDLRFKQFDMWYLMPVCVTLDLLDYRQQIGQIHDRFVIGQAMWVEMIVKERGGEYTVRLATDLYGDRRVASSFGGVPLEIVQGMRRAYLTAKE